MTIDLERRSQPAPPPIRAVLFDLDDTLFDHWHSTIEALTALMNVHRCFDVWSLDQFVMRHSQRLEQVHLEVLAGRLTVDLARILRFSQLASDAGEPVTREQAAVLASDYRRAYCAAWQPVPGAMALLDAIHPRAPIGVVSNNVVGEQLDKIRTCGLERYLDTVVISEEAGVAKPDPRIFEIALARIGCDASEAVMVGDAWGTDVAGARAAGLRVVWFNRFFAECPEPGAVAEIRALAPAAGVADLILGSPSRLPPIA